MKDTTNLIVLGMLLGLLTLSTPVTSTSADPAPSGNQIIETRDATKSNHPRATAVESNSERIGPGINADSTPLKDIADSAKAIYRLAKVGNWAGASDRFASLQKATQSLQANSKIGKTDIAKLNSLLIPLDHLLAAKQPLAMDAANQLALVTTQFAQPNSSLPVEVAMLDYYGRELEIWSTRGNPVKLKAIANKITQLWHDLRPAVQSERRLGQLQSLEDTLVALLDEANSPAEYKLLSAPLLAEVNQLQAVFLRA